MSKKILWLENDSGLIDTYLDILTNAGYKVKTCQHMSDAENQLKNEHYDLLILDVMIPSHNSADGEIYAQEKTEYGMISGLIFYRHNKDRLKELNTIVVVFTIRLEVTIQELFIKEGLPKENYWTRMKFDEPSLFLQKISEFLNK